ncbi:ABC-three component system protein [Dickeya chrysanthemi]|uniref:ABC-three component system protein n=1 Tax=Dickeya chrysanthemi TaxID=556 RepID=UPI00039A86F3|nr:ABC-three component system protein [Dickeya chrysanthemi]MBX9446352.1 serine protease [Dickeya chrysanthemi]
MSIHEYIRKHAVKVNDGSGVLIQCLSEEFSYILTAKHTLKSENRVETWDGQLLTILEVYPHSEDCALLKTPLVSGLPLVRFKSNKFDHKSEAIFGGFPGYRAKEATAETRFKTYEGKIKQLDKAFYLTLEGLPPKAQIEGASGGGVYLIVNEKPYLIGVEIEMAGPQPQEPGVVLCYDMARFDEIVKENDLPPILPSFLFCFSRIRSNTFNYTLNSPRVLNALRRQLHNKAEGLVHDGIPKPYELLALYDKGLIVNGQPDEAMYDLQLWSAYAEFFVLHSLLNDVKVMDLNYLKSMERTSRFVYSRSKDAWLRDLNNIISSARRLLDHGGVLVVSSGDVGSQPIADKSFIKYLVEDIGAPAAEYEYEDGARIDMGLESGDVPFSFALLGSLHRECITRNEQAFLGLNSAQLMELFKDKYADEFNKCK